MYWAVFGVFFLAILTFKDFARGGWIDDRLNWVMHGVSLSLLSWNDVAFWWLAFVIVSFLVLRFVLLRRAVLGEGDVNALGWIWYGLGVLGFSYLVNFLVVFGFVSVLYAVLKLGFFRIREKKPFFIVILISFVFSCWSLGFF